MNVPQTSLESSHFPVMLNEVIKICSPEKGGSFVKTAHKRDQETTEDY